MVTFVMIPAGVLLYRDDTGRTVAEKLAQRRGSSPARPALGMFVVMFVIINLAYFAYGTGFAIIKWTRTATSVACPWPYPEAKVYDPQGFYEKNGQPGPYSVGIWSTWMSAQPDGRPDVELGADERAVCARTMSEPRSVVITGASRGLGLASATHLYRQGWRVVAAMRSLDIGIERLCARRQEPRADDPRLIGVPLDLMDSASIAAAAKMIEAAVGAPYALVHNAGISAAGMVEETPINLWERMFQTTIFGPVALTKALLPSMRAAGRGRIVMVSSAGGVRGMPATAPYSAAKGALERWGESTGRRGRAVRARRDDPGHRHVRHRHHHRRGHHGLPGFRRPVRAPSRHHGPAGPIRHEARRPLTAAVRGRPRQGA